MGDGVTVALRRFASQGQDLTPLLGGDGVRTPAAGQIGQSLRQGLHRPLDPALRPGRHLRLGHPQLVGDGPVGGRLAVGKEDDPGTFRQMLGGGLLADQGFERSPF